MSLFDNLPDYFKKAHVHPQKIRPENVSVSNIVFLRQLAVESYTTRKDQLSGLLSAENETSNETPLGESDDLWPRATLDNRSKKFLFRTLVSRNFDTQEINLLLAEAYSSQEQVNALFVGRSGFWRLVLSPLKRGRNVIVNTEIIRALTKIMTEIHRVSPTSANVTKVLRGLGYVQFVAFSERIEEITPLYVPSIKTVGGVLMAMSMMGAMFLYGRNGSMTFGGEPPEHSGQFNVDPERMEVPSKQLGEAINSSVSPVNIVRETELIKETGNADDHKLPRFKFVKAAKVANVLKGLGLTIESPETLVIKAREVVNLPKQMEPGDAIIVTPQPQLTHAAVKPRTIYTYVRDDEIDTILLPTDVLMTALPITDTKQISPDDYLTVDDKVLVTHPTFEFHGPQKPSALVYGLKLAPSDYAGVLPPQRRFAFVPSTDVDSIFVSPELRAIAPAPSVRSVVAGDYFQGNLPHDVAEGDAIIISRKQQAPDDVDLSEHGFAAIPRYQRRAVRTSPPNFYDNGSKELLSFVRFPEVETTVKEGDTLLVAGPPAVQNEVYAVVVFIVQSAGSDSIFTTGDALTIPATPVEDITGGMQASYMFVMDGMPLLQDTDGAILAVLPRSESSQVIDTIEVTARYTLLKPVKFRRFAFSEPGNIDSFKPVALMAQDSPELKEPEQNQLITWIETIGSESSWDTYKATWSLMGAARDLLWYAESAANQLTSLLPLLGPKLGSMHANTGSAQLEARFSQRIQSFNKLVGGATQKDTHAVARQMVNAVANTFQNARVAVERTREVLPSGDAEVWAEWNNDIQDARKIVNNIANGYQSAESAWAEIESICIKSWYGAKFAWVEHEHAHHKARIHSILENMDFVTELRQINLMKHYPLPGWDQRMDAWATSLEKSHAEYLLKDVKRTYFGHEPTLLNNVKRIIAWKAAFDQLLDDYGLADTFADASFGNMYPKPMGILRSQQREAQKYLQHMYKSIEEKFERPWVIGGVINEIGDLSLEEFEVYMKVAKALKLERKLAPGNLWYTIDRQVDKSQIGWVARLPLEPSGFAVLDTP